MYCSGFFSRNGREGWFRSKYVLHPLAHAPFPPLSLFTHPSNNIFGSDEVTIENLPAFILIFRRILFLLSVWIILLQPSEILYFIITPSDFIKYIYIFFFALHTYVCECIELDQFIYIEHNLKTFVLCNSLNVSFSKLVNP